VNGTSAFAAPGGLSATLLVRRIHDFNDPRIDG
jgi:hypothetical protein